MLKLARDKGQRIFLGSGKDRIIITLVESHGTYSVIGIDAPISVTILREELYNRQFDRLEAPPVRDEWDFDADLEQRGHD